MRSSVTLLAFGVIACLAGSGWTQHYAGYYAPPYRYGPCNPYVGPLPPYLMGGPAYGYTYPTPWYGYCPYPPGPRSYIAPPYAYYQPSVQTHSLYSPVPYYYPVAATPRSDTNPAKGKASKGTPLPGKEPPAPPAEKAAERESSPLPKSTKRSTSLWHRLIYW